MTWNKLGKIWAPSGALWWARHSFMTPVPIQMANETIRIYGGVRDGNGVSRIAWIEVDCANPLKVLGVSPYPVLNIGAPGMFDDNGVILGDVLRVSDTELRMYYVGFQLVAKAKFLAFTGLAVSHDNGNSFERLQPTPILDRAPQALFINALHSIMPIETGYRAWVSCGQRWEIIHDVPYPQYNCWTVPSPDGVHFDMTQAVKCIDVSKDEYRIGRPRASFVDGKYELRVTSDTREKHYASSLAYSADGIAFARTDIVELPQGLPEEWDGEMTCYPARLETEQGEVYLFYNGNGMGQSGVGVAKWIPE